MGGEETPPVKPHAIQVLNLKVQGLRVLNGDHAILTHLSHHLGDKFSDLWVVAGDGCHVRDLLLSLHLHSLFADGLQDHSSRLFDPPFKQHGVGSGGDILHRLVNDSLCQYRGGGSAVANHVIGPHGSRLHQLGPHVLATVL